MEHSSAPSSTNSYDLAREALYGPVPSTKQTGFFGSDSENTSLAVRQITNNPFLDSVGEEVVAVELVEPVVIEALSPEQAIEKFKASWQLPDKMLEQQAERFDTITSNVLGSLTEYSKAKLVHSVADKLQWLYFGKDGEPLPDNFAIVESKRTDEGKITAQYDTVRTTVADVVTPMSGFNESRILKSFQHFGLTSINVERKKFRNQAVSSDEMKVAHDALLENSPFMQFLVSFKSAPTQKSNRPLTLFEKQIRTAQSENDVRQKYGISANQDMRLYTNAQRALARTVAALDEETLPTIKDSVSEIDVLKDFILQDLQKWHQSLKPSDVRLNYSAIKIAQDIRGGYFNDDTDLYAKSLADTLADISDKPLLVDGQVFMQEAIQILFVANLNSVDELIAQLMRSNLFNTVNLPHLYDEKCLSVNQILAIRGVATFAPTVSNLNAHPDEVFDSDSRVSFLHDKDYQSGGGIVSKEEQERKKQCIVGSVERFIDDPVDRLITTGNRVFSFKPSTQAAVAIDMRLHLKSLADNEVPSVPGYDLVAYDDIAQTYDFSKQLQDPYDRATIELSLAEKQAMIQRAHDLDVPNALIRKLNRGAHTLADVAEIIASSSEYTYEANQSGKYPWMYVKRGKLQLQCSGAAELVQFLLNQVNLDRLGQVRIGAISGLLLAADDDKITLEYHRQNVVTYGDGTISIFDATPSDPNDFGSLKTGLEAARNRYRLTTVIRRKIGSVIVKKNIELQTIAVADLAEKARIPTTAANPNEPARLKEKLVTILKPILKTVDEIEVFERLVSLGTDDPLHRIAELVLRSANGNAITQTEVTATQSYLETLKTADKNMLKQLKIVSYTPETLQSLQTFIQRLPLLTAV